jgi:hypothetical protein
MIGFDQLSSVDGVGDRLASLILLGILDLLVPAGVPFHDGPIPTSPLAWLRQVRLIAFLLAAGTVSLAGIRLRKGLRKFRHQECLLAPRALFGCAVRNQPGPALLSSTS